MYLKSIEINGFKSFANRMVFEFEHGFTGIVGPNGSGKSNVADAVRWVLGEQSAKQLRGTRMEDVIFAGTQNRKPLGFAYVALTMDNSDHSLPVEYDEVIVARRVYRSGESEYLLNGSTCRLKDIQSMFMDTGVGKEGYSIIGQGQIDKILSGKPEERRELFDEAAGIVKYKKNKAAAEKSLESERDNLTRVNDIISELERQVGPLKKQSEVARQYLQYREELKTLDVNTFLLESDDLGKQLEEIEEKAGIVNGDMEDTRLRLETTKREFDVLEKKKEEASAVIEGKRAELSELKLQVQKAQGEINVFNEQINTAKMNDTHITNRLTQIEEALLDKDKEKDKLYEQKNVFDEKLDEIDSRQTQAEEELDKTKETISSLNERVESYKSDIVAFVNESAELKGKVARYDAMLENVGLRKAELNQRLLTYRSEQQAQEKVIADCEKNRREFRQQVDELLKDMEKNEQILKELSDKQNLNRSKLSQAEQEFHRSRSQLETLKNMAERYDGYGNSIKRVMEERKHNPGIHGVVADIITVKKAYETAVETALGGSIQNIVTEDEQTAKKLIAILKKERAGRATFLPLSSISKRGSFQRPEALKETGAIGLANSLVKVDKQYEELMEHLLGRILVVDTIDHAIAIARKYNQSLRIVTVEGESINPGGAMSGGAYKNSSNLLGRRREMEELQIRIEACKERLESARKKEIEISNARKEHKDMVEQYTSALQDFKLKENTLKVNEEQARSRIDDLKKSIDHVEAESKELTTQVATITESKEKLYAGNVAQEQAMNAREEAIKQLEEEIAKLLKQEQEQQERVNELLMEFQSVEQESSFLMSNLKRIKEEEKVLNLEKEELIEKTGFAFEEIEAITRKIAECNQRIESANLSQQSLEEELDKLVLELNTVTASHKDFFAKHQELTTRQAELDKEGYRLETRKEKVKEQQESLNNYMWAEYELDYYNAMKLRDEALKDLTELKKQSASMKRSIKALGDVNVNSIEEYKEVSERYEFLSKQREDIVSSEQNLLGILEELDAKMREQFSEKFAEIQSMFAVVFKEMFGGGNASLILNEEEDILTAGIQINAQPPGKKLQNMMQLSGGEKALTAIALLFAIQNLKPSPFCLLDEIEAALDDSNVDRFARYIHKLTAHTQFIVITHRRGTMTAADVLYGITMQEKGVSTLVSVNLIEEQLEKEEKKA